jgi:hypothetical protein
MTKSHNPYIYCSTTEAEQGLGVHTLIRCNADGFPNWIAECSPAAVGVGLTRNEAVRIAVAKYRTATTSEAPTDEPEPDYGGAMDSTGHVYSDAEGGL